MHPVSLLLSLVAALSPGSQGPGAMHLARASAAPRARAALDCQGTEHLVLSVPLHGRDGGSGPAALPEGTVLLDREGRAARLDHDLHDRVLGACCIELHGGELTGWWDAMFPRGRRSTLGRALHAAWRRGTPLLGVDAGAALLCGGGPACTGPWPIEEPDSHDDLVEGRALSGLGLGPLPLLAWGDDAQTGPSALLDAMERFGVEAGAWLEGDCWLRYDSRTRDMTIHGPGRLALLVLDGPHRARRVQGALWELGDGATWQPWRKRILTPDPTERHPPLREERLLGRHRILVESTARSLVHQPAEGLPSRAQLRATLLRRGLVGHDPIPAPAD